MSYALTDAGEDEMRAEIQVLTRINEELDQLAAEARGCATVAPLVKRAIDLAWYMTEAALREHGMAPCGHPAPIKECEACRWFSSVQISTQNIRRQL